MPTTYRDLPAVHTLLADERVAPLPVQLATHCAREVLDELRVAISGPGLAELPDVAGQVALRVVELLKGRIRPVHNATGVVLHTNLGRAPWADEAVAAAVSASGYCNLELSLRTGRRGGRIEGVRRLLCALTGAQDAVVVNNGAAALLLALTALAVGRDVLVSRGELVEIGGSFRVPDIVAAGGARLVEVGTTNRTHISDYERSSSADSAVLLSVHPSNFRIVGFAEVPSRDQRQAMAERCGLVHVEDVGSGNLGAHADEPSVRDAVAAGVDLVVFSGDKLLGGPQAGFAVGRSAVVQQLRHHPMYRALRLDKTLLAATQATLALHARRQPTAVDAMMSATDLEERARELSQRLGQCGVTSSICAVEGATGGGARPELALPSWAVRVPCAHPSRVAAGLRQGEPSVLVRIVQDALMLDLRTLRPDSYREVAARVACMLARS